MERRRWPLPSGFDLLWAGLLLFLSTLTVSSSSALESEEAVADLGHGPLQLKWETDVGRAVVQTPLLIPGGLLTVSTDRKLYRHDLETGHQRWKRRCKKEIGTRPVYAELASGDERVFVYVGSGNGGRLRALQGEDGKDVWTRTLAHRPTSMAWAEGALWVLDISGRLARLDPEDGTSTWNQDGLGWDPPALLVDAEMVYVLSRQDSLRAFSARPEAARPVPPEELGAGGNREEGGPEAGAGADSLTEVGTDAEADSLTEIGVDAEPDSLTEFGIGAEADSLTEIVTVVESAVEIRQVWSTALEGRFVAPPVRIGEHIFVCSTEGRLSQVEARTGQVVHEEFRETEQLFAAVETGIGILTVSSDGQVELVGPEHRWTLDIDAAVSAEPVAAGPLVLVSTSIGELVALNVEVGEVAWKLDLEDPLRVAPILTPRYLILATNRGDLFVYDHR